MLYVAGDLNFSLLTDTTSPNNSPMEWRGRISEADDVTIGEAAELLGLAPQDILSLVETDRLPARTDCSVIRISLADIEIYRRRSGSGVV